MKRRHYPGLSAEDEVEIEEDQKRIHEKYWPYLAQFSAPNSMESFFQSSSLLVTKPPIVKQPKKLIHILRQYAAELFEVEAKRYPESEFLKLWLNDLKNKTYNIMTDRMMQMDNLRYHASEDSMREAIWVSLETAVLQNLDKPLPGPKTQVADRSPSAKMKRLKSTITSPAAVKKLDAYLEAKGIGLTDFASRAQTTDRTLRSFRKTGKVRRDIFTSIAKAMGMTKDELLGD
jgi:hypothetical protein